MFLKPRTQVDPVLTDLPVNFGKHTTPGCGVFRLPRGARRASAAGFAQPRAPAPLHAHMFSATTTASVRSATVCIRELIHSSAYVPKTTPIRALSVFVQLFWRFCKNPGLFWRGFCEVDCGRLASEAERRTDHAADAPMFAMTDALQSASRIADPAIVAKHTDFACRAVDQGSWIWTR
ncbi:hypothetical protein OH76DRAFT_153589 [Lentinus brumalis]|uniref:Uncharacterized protein n=1 Tax=Lentinus brumalis TaxID=2498619 RepID=A0A371CNZ1_9APHY|nr:hypothetical protein OH76DRAFT_153589 [Polyporus brumalis]